jgi:hypothetical protein
MTVLVFLGLLSLLMALVLTGLIISEVGIRRDWSLFTVFVASAAAGIVVYAVLTLAGMH